MKREWARKAGPIVLLVLVGLGAFLWKGGLGLLPVERTLVWKVPGEFASVRRLEMRLYEGSTLLKADELFTPQGLNVEPTQKLVLERGQYQAELSVWREGAAEPKRERVAVVVDDAEVLVVQPP